MAAGAHHATRREAESLMIMLTGLRSYRAQMCSGRGCCAGGRLNRFNVVKQSRDYDPDGAYIRAWLPELAGCPDEAIHEPWLMPAEQQVAHMPGLLR